MNPGHHIDYKQLRALDSPAARMSVLNYLESIGGNVKQTAKVFSINRCVVYDILKKRASEDLADRSRAPRYQPRKTPACIADQVITAKNKTHFGPIRLSLYLARYEGLKIAAGTIRHILRRNRDRLIYKSFLRRSHKEKREFIDWYSAKPFEIVQIDLKHIRDQKALSQAQILHLDRYDIPITSGVRLMSTHASNQSPIRVRSLGPMACAGIYGSSPGCVLMVSQTRLFSRSIMAKNLAANPG